MNSMRRLMLSLLVGAFAVLAMTPARAQNDPCSSSVNPGTCFDTFVAVNIWVGTVLLYSAGGTLLSTNTYMTVESWNEGVGTDPVTTFLAPLEAASDATYIEGNTIFPTFVRENIASFVGGSGLGTAWDGVTTPSPAEQVLYSLLTTQVPPFVITSDTGDVAFGMPFEFVNAYGPFGPVTGSSNDYVIGTSNIDVYERTIDERLTSAVPEPSTWALMLLGFAGLGIAGVRASRKRIAVEA
jgi:PEP-CTERM motif